MAYPPAYVRAYSFTDYEVNFPGQPKPGDKLDTEYDAVSNALTATQDSLALIQRADGALANDSVGEDQLQDGLLDGIVDGVTADAEAAAAAAAASASAAAGSAAAADASAVDVAVQVAIAAGHAASAGVSQGIAQGAATAAAASADEAGMAADVSITAATSVENSVAQAQLHEEMAFKWAEYLAAPVMPAPPGWPEAVDDGMFSAKWWALRARDYNEVHEYDFGTAGTNPGEAFDIWDLTNDLEDPPGLVYMTWGTPPRTYVLTDPSNPSDPNSWMDITGADGPPGPVGPIGPPGPPNTLTIGTVTTGLPGTPADATITGTAPNQTLNMTIPAGADGTGTTLVAASGTIGLTVVPGSATTAARSDSTPPLSQAIEPTWTGEHKFTGTTTVAAFSMNGLALGNSGGTNPIIWIRRAASAAHQKNWVMIFNAGGFEFVTYDDTPAGPLNILKVGRAAAQAISDLTFGNTTNNPAYNFLGTGTATFNGTVDLLGPLHATGVAGVSGQVLSSQGAGLPAVWRTSSGGSIELGWNFSSAVGTANPGSQKASLNSAVYSSVTIAVFNSLAFTNFDANTILSLLNVGNRIYMQQRNDATKAVVYEVTGPGTQLTGYWTIPVKYIDSRGTIFPNNADLNCVFILSVSSAGFPLLAPDGTAAAPSYSFLSDPDTGMFSNGANQLGFSAGGAFNFLVYSTLLRANVPLQLLDGTAGGPSLTFTNDPSTGMYRFGSGIIGFTTTGAYRMSIANTYVDFTGVAQMFAPNGTIAAPAYAFANDTDTGLYRAAANYMIATIGGAFTCGFYNQGVNPQTVFPDGSAGAPPISFASALGSGMYRNAANSDARLVYGGVESFYWSATYSGTLLPFLFSDGTAAAPSITFRLDTDTGIYRGGANIMGLVAGGLDVLAIRADLANPCVSNVSGSAAVPAYSFQSDTDTGMYRIVDNNVGFAAGGVYRFGYSTTVLNVRLLIQGADGTAAAPSYSFENDADTGLYRGAADELHIATGGVQRAIFFNSGLEIRPGGSLYNADGAAATPSYTFGNDTNTGMYRVGGDQIGFASGGAHSMTIYNGRIYNGIGSAALPAYSFTNDPDTGIWNSSAGLIDFAINGVNTMELSATTLFAPSFSSSSSRAVKRETGKPSFARDILARLRPILYRLLVDERDEQLGLIAEEVHEVCPQLSDGKSVAYDRLAILLLAAWQEEHLEAA